MDLIKITDLSAQLGLSSRTLRYYEEAGLITSIRPQFEAYRFYDEAAVERLRQIIILRKMQIPIKDIVRIYENPEIATLVDVFVGKINEIDGEVTVLSELKSIINTFLKKMIESGIKKISALPLLYEEIDKQLELMEEQKPVTYETLEAVSEKLSKPIEPAIISLPTMRMLSSFLKDDPKTSDIDGFWHYALSRDIRTGAPGLHEQFEYQTRNSEAVMLRLPDNFINDSDYLDFSFKGGLFAAANVYVDEDLGACFRSLIGSFDDNKFYEIDYMPDGNLRHPALLENLISPDEKRELVSLLVPVKKRLADPALFDKPVEIPPDSITIEEIEAQSPVLWEKDVPLDKLIPINSPHYKLLDSGEVEYTGWISTRVLSTDTTVKLPYRVDIEYRVDFDSMGYGYGDSEGSIIFYHGNDLSYPNGVNTGNHTTNMLTSEAISFCQPVFHDRFNLPKRGKIKRDAYNAVTWIVGAKHFAVIINGEIRYCGIKFPYMYLDLNSTAAKLIVIGSNGQGKKYIRKIKVSQLKYTPNTKLKKEELTMITKQSNNIIPIIHRLVTSEHGENYWFNAKACYVMECLGEADYDYSFFAGLTGDNFTQHYKFGFPGDAASACRQVNRDSGYFEDILAKCGYFATCISVKDICKNKEMYLQTLMAYIDKGVPVISLGAGGTPAAVYAGYEESGKTLLYISGDNAEPQRVSYKKALESSEPDIAAWIFVGEKKENIPLAKIYRDAIISLPEQLTTNNDTYCFGASAFRKWADDIDGGIFDDITPDKFDGWGMYQNFVCVLATNSSCCYSFLDKAQVLNSDMKFLKDVGSLYSRMKDMWGELETLGGGFNVTLEVLKDKEKRAKIANKIREFAEVTDEVVKVLKNGLKE
ncbi:MAG: MerR family transcriptional regulator [Eubacteriales bacterium]|nr:MerR family transcriptional regulator [Eubacteriales bacterium]